MKQKSLKLNAVMNILLTVSSVIFPLISFPYVSRILLPSGTGKVSLATSLIAYFDMFAQLGIPTYGIRVCAQVRDNQEELTRTAQELLIINLIMDAIVYIALALAIILIPKIRQESTLYIIVSATIILNSIGMEWLYKALEQYTYITIRSVIFKFIALIGMFLLIHHEGDYLIYGALTIFAASISNIFNLINVHRYISLKPVGKYNFIRHLKPVFIFFAMACATTVYTNLDTVMLGFMRNNEEVGFYNAAVKLKSVLVRVVTALGVVMLPRLSYYIEHQLLDDFKNLTQKALNFVLIISLPMTVYFIIYAQEGVRLISGRAYDNSIVPMQIIMPTLLIIGLSNVLGIQILVPLGKEKTVLFAEILGAIADLIINAILIPRFASSGAAIGTLVAELVVLVYECIALKGIVREAFKNIKIIKIISALLVSCVTTCWVRNLNYGNFMTLLISGVFFFAVYVVMLLITKEELTLVLFNQIMSKILKRVKK